MRVGQVRLVFSLPEAVADRLFASLPLDERPPRHLAYVDWFTPFTRVPERDSGLYRLKRQVHEGDRLSSVTTGMHGHPQVGNRRELGK